VRQDWDIPSGSVLVLDQRDRCSYRKKHGLRIETLALPGEDPAGLRALLDQWYDAYQPVSPGEFHLVDMAVYDLIRIRRCRRCQEAVEEKLIRDIRNRWSIEQEKELNRFKALLVTDPTAAVAELKRFAFGCAWLINGWEQLRSLMETEGETSVDVGAELPVFPVGDAIHKVLSSEETDYLTRVYCLLAQDAPKEGDILAFYRAWSLFPEGGPLPSRGSLPPRWQCRRRVRTVIGREVASLRILYEKLHAECDQPALEAAVNAAIARDPHRASVLRARRQCEKSFHANYKLLLEMRKGFALPSVLPGGPIASGDLRKKRA
jgi:hypothetical protein